MLDQSPGEPGDAKVIIKGVLSLLDRMLSNRKSNPLSTRKVQVIKRL
jgi:hypothetical protein